MLGRLGANVAAWIDGRVESMLTQTRPIEGMAVSVFNMRGDIDTERLFERTAQALALIVRHDARRFRRLSRDFSAIHVRRGLTRGAYYRASRLCVLDNTFVANAAFSEVQIASTIVHEAMHARLDRAGVRTTPKQHAREERLCRKAEIEFGLRVPGGDAIIARAAAALEASDEDVAPMIDPREVQRRVQAADLEALRAPEWVKRVIARRQGIDRDGG